MSILNFITTDAQLSMPVTTYQVLLEKAASDERERIIKLLEDRLFQYDDGVETYAIGLESTGLPTSLDAVIALIKGENKTNLWTSRPRTEEDKEHYGLEGENK